MSWPDSGMDRRAWIQRSALGLLGAGTLSTTTGCGFALRTTTLPFQRVALMGFADRSPMSQVLREAMGATVQWVAAPEQAEVVLVSLAESRVRTVAAFSATRRVSELRLEVQFRFKAQGRDGKELLAPAELKLVRDMSYSETQAQGKAFEEQRLYREMESDIAQQVMRRLATLQPPETPAAAGPVSAAGPG
jgi:LPS-assembly lipoprotein